MTEYLNNGDAKYDFHDILHVCVCVNLHLLVSRCYLFAKELFRAWYVRLICKYISWAAQEKTPCLFNDLCHYPVVCTMWEMPGIPSEAVPQRYPVEVKEYLLGLQRWHVGILFNFLRITFYHMQSKYVEGSTNYHVIEPHWCIFLNNLMPPCRS